MRRKDRAIPIEEARILLETAEYGVLSMASLDGAPHGIPLNFAFAGDYIYFHCASEGKKIDLLSKNAKGRPWIRRLPFFEKTHISRESRK